MLDDLKAFLVAFVILFGLFLLGAVIVNAVF